MEAAVLFIVFAILLFMGAPIAVCLGVSSVAAMLVMLAGRPVDIILGTVPQLVSAATSKAVLQAIPFFILGGNIMDASGISRKLIHLAEACVGHLRGGVAMVCVLVACFFAAISGSGPATVAALGIIVIPALVKAGYDTAFAAALMATAGSIGVIIPPSITFVVYGSISDTSIGDLFIAGVLPGLLMGAALIADREARAYPDVVAFGFFCRRANLEALAREYEGAVSDRLGRGLSFHIAPSNVPVNFAYSLAAGLLAGNACVVKASSRDFPQTRIICRVMDLLLRGAHAALANHVCVVIYPRDRQDVTEMLSAQCDARIIWGGDETVRRVRMAPLAPRAVEVAFPDRYSLLAVDAKSVLALDGKALAAAARGFYNDTYLTDQNACTSPRLVYWLGGRDAVTQAQARFWEAVRAYAAPRYPIEPVVAVDKLTAAFRAAAALPGAAIAPMPDNTVVRVQVSALTPDIDEHRCAGGFFVEYAAETLDSLIPVVKRKYQTLSYLGLEPEALRRFVRENALWGVDRIAPVGHTMDFALTWDGYDLIRTLSRRISAI